MKKLMFAASAALCAAVGFADVTSANVVGYSQYPLQSGSTMAGAAFTKIAASGTTLTQILPMGYLSNPKWIGGKSTTGCNGKIKVQFLNKNGAVDTDKNGDKMEYLWYHTATKGATGKWNDDACWKQYKKGVLTIIDASNDVQIDKGQALWINVTDWCEGIAFQNAGEALLDAGDVPLNSGSTAVVVPISKSCKLTDLVPMGYLSNPKWIGGKSTTGCNGKIKVQFLNKNGAVDTDENEDKMEYLWYHTATKGATGKWNDDACWKQYKKGVLTVITPENAPTIDMGQGLWMNVTDWCEGIFVRGPGIDDTPSAE